MINPTTREQYEEYAKGACKWCKKGYPNYASTMGRKFHYFDDRDKECTAMPFEAWVGWRIERLTEALKACETFVMRVDLETYRELRDRALAAQPESGVTK